MPPSTWTCHRCKSANPEANPICTVCGAGRSGSPDRESRRTRYPEVAPHGADNAGYADLADFPAPSGESKSAVPPADAELRQPRGWRVSLFGWLGWARVDGRVVQVEPVVMGPADFRWIRMLLIFVALGLAAYYVGWWLAAPPLLALTFLWLLAMIFPAGVVSGIAVQMVSFLLTRRLMGPGATVPIRDIRIRDDVGQEHLIRLQGHLIAGNLGGGDDVSAEGWRRSGMLLFRRGFNRRLNVDIRVRV